MTLTNLKVNIGIEKTIPVSNNITLPFKSQQLSMLAIYHSIPNKVPSNNYSQELEMLKILSWVLIMMVIHVDSVL